MTDRGEGLPGPELSDHGVCQLSVDGGDVLR